MSTTVVFMVAVVALLAHLADQAGKSERQKREEEDQAAQADAQRRKDWQDAGPVLMTMGSVLCGVVAITLWVALTQGLRVAFEVLGLPV